MSGLSKSYESKEIEQKWYRLWEEGGYFKPGKDGEPYCIVMPPPNVTGRLHVGHALDITTQDILVRFKRMQGCKALLLPGMDHAGIATQNVVERELYAKENKKRQDYTREEFVAKVWEWKEEYGGIIAHQQRLMGVSADWNYSLFTMDPDANAAVKRAFVALYEEGLIYQSDYIVNWDPVLRSAISDAEVEHREVEGAFYHIFYRIKGSDDRIEIATTRPETLLGDTAVCVHPDDERFGHLVGKMAIVPLASREVPIIADDYVETDKGTGCLKVTPGHDFNDFEIGRRHELPIVNILNEDGTLNGVHPDYAGMGIKEARKAIVEALRETGQLKQIKKHVHKVGHGNRSKAVVEPLVSKQWFVNVQEMARASVEAIEHGPTAFWPKEWENTYFSWMRNPKDWCISRQLWWGHQIPVFYCRKADCAHAWASEAVPKECPKCATPDPRQDPDVLDTWFSSALWPLTTLGWPLPKRMEEKHFSTFFPTATLVTGFDIIFFWVARMMMMALKFKNIPPFKDIYIHAIVRDKLGRKMSKSLGNGIDPLDMVEQYGADALRFTLAAGSGYNRTLNLDPDRIVGHRHFINKIWNAFRFIHPFLGEANDEGIGKPDHHERWILAEFNETAKSMNTSLEEYRFDEACSAIYKFVYESLCSWFIELSKPVLYGDDSCKKIQRIRILKYSFKKTILLLHPICPFITEELWNFFKAPDEERIIVADYPNYAKDLDFASDQRDMNVFIDAVRTTRNLRASVNMSPKETVPVHLFVIDETLHRYFSSQSSAFGELAGARSITVGMQTQTERPRRSLMGATPQAEVFIPLEGIIDIDAQVGRLEKSLTKIRNQLQKCERKLGNDEFLRNAHPEAIAKVRTEMEELRAKLSPLKARIGMLQSH